MFKLAPEKYKREKLYFEYKNTTEVTYVMQIKFERKLDASYTSDTRERCKITCEYNNQWDSTFKIQG